MPTIAIHASVISSMSAKNKKVRNALGTMASFGLTDGAPYRDPQGVSWQVWDDHRWTIDDIAYFGVYGRSLNQVNTQTPEEWVALKAWLDSRNPAPVLAAQIPTLWIDNANPWLAILQANNAPVQMWAGSGVGTGWVPI